MIIWNKFVEFLKTLLIEGIQGSLTEFFKSINTEVANVQSQLSMTPESWNTGLWNMVNSICDTVIKPVAGAVLACFICLDIVMLMNDKNNLHSTSDLQSAFIKFFIKLCIAALLVENTSKIVLLFFKVGTYLINGAADYIGSTELNAGISAQQVAESLQDESFHAVLGYYVLIMLERFVLLIISYIIRAAVIGRMFEIYIYCSLAPISLATFAGRGELISIGINYLKNLGALAIQGFLMMMCVGFYSAIINEIATTGDLQSTLFELLVCAGVLTISIIKSSTMARSILTAR